MQHALFIALFAGLLSMFGWGLADIFVKRVVDNIGDLAPLFWSQLTGIFPLFILFLWNPGIPHLSGSDWGYLFMIGILDGLAYIPLYIAFRKGVVSLLSPIYATYPLFVAIFSAIFFGEVIPLDRQIIFIVIFIGILMINGDPRAIWSLISGKREASALKGFPEILLAVFLNSLYVIALSRLISHTSWIPISLFIRVLSTLSLFVYAKVTRKKITFHERKLWKFIVLIGLLDVLAFSSLSYGLSASSYISVIVMLSSAFSLPVIVIGHFFLKEKASKIQIIGSLITVLGIMLLSLL